MIDERAYYLIDAYLNDQLTEQEQQEFKTHSKDPSFLEELEIQKQLFINNTQPIDRTEFSKNENGKQILEGIATAEKNYFQEEPKKGKVRYLNYGIAASILLIVSLVLINFLTGTKSLENYYAENVNWDQLPSLVERVEEDNILVKGAMAFQNKKYDEAIKIFTAYLNEYPNNSQVVMYLGASYLESGDDTSALQTFDHLTQMNSVDKTRGYWYIALIHLKNNDQKQAVMTLENIVGDEKNYNYLKAKEILTQIKSE